MADVERLIVDLIAGKKRVDAARISSVTTFAELGIDSLDAIDIIFSIEDAFKIVVPDEAAQAMKTVGQVIEGVQRLVAQSGAS